MLNSLLFYYLHSIRNFQPLDSFCLNISFKKIFCLNLQNFVFLFSMRYNIFMNNRRYYLSLEFFSFLYFSIFYSYQIVFLFLEEKRSKTTSMKERFPSETPIFRRLIRKTIFMLFSLRKIKISLKFTAALSLLIGAEMHLWKSK